MMQLDPAWRLILTRAWSVWLMAAAALLTVAELFCGLWLDTARSPWLALLSAGLTLAAIVARVWWQADLQAAVRRVREPTNSVTPPEWSRQEQAE